MSKRATPPPVKVTHVLKSNGERVPFREEKLRVSLAKAGASPDTIDFIIGEVEGIMHDGITTKKIYQTAFSKLKKESHTTAARYKLKRAIRELGPSGYPFEQYVGELLRLQGYAVEVGILVEGACVSHEVDVLGKQEKRMIAVECKFGNSKDKKLDIKVILYIHSRFQDIAKRWGEMPEHEGKEFQGWVVTNGYFSSDAIEYGECVGLKLMGWNYPPQGNLKELIDVCQMHPVTSLTTLKKREKDFLIDKGIILCRDLLNREDLFEELDFSNFRRKKALDEIMGLCG